MYFFLVILHFFVNSFLFYNVSSDCECNWNSSVKFATCVKVTVEQNFLKTSLLLSNKLSRMVCFLFLSWASSSQERGSCCIVVTMGIWHHPKGWVLQGCLQTEMPIIYVEGESVRERERGTSLSWHGVCQSSGAHLTGMFSPSLWWWLRLLIAAWGTESARAKHLISFALQPNGVVVTWKHPSD